MKTSRTHDGQPIPIQDLWKYDLRRGNTDHPSNGACLFDAGMWLGLW